MKLTAKFIAALPKIIELDTEDQSKESFDTWLPRVVDIYCSYTREDSNTVITKINADNSMLNLCIRYYYDYIKEVN